MIRGSIRKILVVAFVLLICGSISSAKFPRPVGYVNDFANIISPEAENLIEAIALQVKEKTGAEIAVVTIETTHGVDIEQYAVDLFMAWGIGERGKDNGILILVAFKDKKLWIKPGYGIEGAVPDAEAHRIYRKILRPGFQAGRYDDALVEAVTEIANLILADAGEHLSLSDSTLLTRFTQRSAGGRQGRIYPMVLLGIIMLVWLLVFIRAIAMRGSHVGRGGGFWIGGIGGSSGGFGGGFGGFGGGSCGGGGAGGGW